MRKFERIAFLDDRETVAAAGFPIEGSLAACASLRTIFAHAIAAFSDNALRLVWHEKLLAMGFYIPVLCHAASVVSPGADIGPGTVLMAGAIVNIGAKVGRACILNTGCSVDHDCVVDEGVHIAPGARIAGGVTVGARSWIGIGASVANNIRIGNDCVLAAGAALIHDAEPGGLYAGVPAVRKK
jgi:sugar O-acyltransferase (sialic acid O-acetyltransferase NeuD family)